MGLQRSNRLGPTIRFAFAKERASETGLKLINRLQATAKKEHFAMRLYRAKIPTIAKDVIDTLCADGDIEVAPESREEAEADLVAIMEEFTRRDAAFRNQIRDEMANNNIPYDRYGKIRKQMAEEKSHPIGDDIERFLCRQFIENMMISRFVDEVYEEDRLIYRKVMGVMCSHDVDEREIREEAQGKIKNLREGTVDYEIALQSAVRDVKKRRGLL